MDELYGLMKLIKIYPKKTVTATILIIERGCAKSEQKSSYGNMSGYLRIDCVLYGPFTEGQILHL
jgi:hypothetical protein